MSCWDRFCFLDYHFADWTTLLICSSWSGTSCRLSSYNISFSKLLQAMCCTVAVTIIGHFDFHCMCLAGGTLAYLLLCHNLAFSYYVLFFSPFMACLNRFCHFCMAACCIFANLQKTSAINTDIFLSFCQRNFPRCCKIMGQYVII